MGVPQGSDNTFFFFPAKAVAQAPALLLASCTESERQSSPADPRVSRWERKACKRMGEIFKDLQTDLVAQIVMKAIVTLLEFFFSFDSLTVCNAHAINEGQSLEQSPVLVAGLPMPNP